MQTRLIVGLQRVCTNHVGSNVFDFNAIKVCFLVNPEGSAQLVRFGDFILEVASSSLLKATGGFPGR